MNNYKLRITKCYYIEVIDSKGKVVDYIKDDSCHEASDFCFGTKEDAKIIGNSLITEVVENS